MQIRLLLTGATFALTPATRQQLLRRIASIGALTLLFFLTNISIVHAQIASLVAKTTQSQPAKTTPPSPKQKPAPAPISSTPTPTPTRAAYFDKKEIALFALLQGTTIYDFETTFRTLRDCPTCKEGNPIMRPFIKAGRPATHAFGTAVNALGILGARHLHRQGKKWWFVPILAHAGIHIWAGRHNQKIQARSLQQR